MAVETRPRVSAQPDNITPPTRGRISTLGGVMDAPLPKEPTIDSDAQVYAPKKMRRRTKVFLGSAAIVAALGGSGLAYAVKHPDQAVEVSNTLIGRENTIKLEGRYFAARDRIHRLKYQVFGGQENPFGNYTPDPRPMHASHQPPFYEGYIEPDIILPPEPPAPIVLPETRVLLRDSKPGEGAWTTKDLPLSSPEDMLMAKT